MANKYEIKPVNGELPAHAFPGGYPIYYVLDDGERFGDCCAECAAQLVKDEEAEITLANIHWEGPAIVCDDCGREIESAYGDPNREDDPTTTMIAFPAVYAIASAAPNFYADLLRVFRAEDIDALHEDVIDCAGHSLIQMGANHEAASDEAERLLDYIS